MTSSPWVLASDERALESRSPADRGAVVGTYAPSVPEDVERATARAREAFGSWSSSTPAERTAVLTACAVRVREEADPLARLLAREGGKPVAEARAEIENAARVFEFYATAGYKMKGETIPSNRPGVELRTRRVPVGPMGLITPWNFPVNMPAIKIAPALACGNTVVLKPASATVLTTLRFIELLYDAGLPEDAVTVVIGEAEIGSALVDSEALEGIAFTGSSAVGRTVAAAAASSGKRFVCEMGGKNALVVMADADLDMAVELTLEGAFRSSGQKCTATSRVILEDSVHDEFLSRLTAAVADLTIGDPLAAETFLGPLITSQHRDNVVSAVEAGLREGARLEAGGDVPSDGSLAAGNYVRPTVLSTVEPHMGVAREEIFGPVVALLRADDIGAAVELVNDSPYGLTASICTRDVDAAIRFAREADVGVGNVNLATAGLEFQAPFGGEKISGSDRKELGDETLDFYSKVRTLAVRPSAG